MIAHDPSNPEQETLFTDEALQQFEVDDRTAIARILSTLFIYTLIVMSIALW